MNTPCRGCPDREIGCHGRCDRYAEYQAILDRERKKRYYAWLANEEKAKAIERTTKYHWNRK